MKKEREKKRDRLLKLRVDQKTSERIRVEWVQKIGKQERSLVLQIRGPSTRNDVKCLTLREYLREIGNRFSRSPGSHPSLGSVARVANASTMVARYIHDRPAAASRTIGRSAERRVNGCDISRRNFPCKQQKPLNPKLSRIARESSYLVHNTAAV